MSNDSKIFLDTNILVYAILNDFDREKYEKVKSFLNDFNKEYQFCISSQILREFYAVVTNSKYLKNPLTPDVANEVITFFQDNLLIYIITNGVINQLKILCEKYNIFGQKVHDATIAATMIENNINKIYTFNHKDFSIFKEISIIS